MAWRHPGNKPSSEPMLVSLLTHMCVTRPQLVNSLFQRLINMTFNQLLPTCAIWHIESDQQCLSEWLDASRMQEITEC